MRALFSGEHRRAAIMGVVGAPVIMVLLIFRLLAPADSGMLPAPVGPAPPAATIPPVAVITPPAPAPASSIPVDPALLRDPFCALVAVPPAPVGCQPRTVPPGRQAIRLEDIFAEGNVRLARMQVGRFTFPNLHEDDDVGGSFRVVSLSERCGEFEFAGNPFSLCEGEQAIR